MTVSLEAGSLPSPGRSTRKARNRCFSSQVNLEYLAKVVQKGPHNGLEVAYPDSLVGTDSHTTMINGLGVLGWGVGGIEAEAVMLGQPIYFLLPEVIWCRALRRILGTRGPDRFGCSIPPK